MTILENDLCKIDVAVDETYPSDAEFKNKYDILLKLLPEKSNRPQA